MSGKYAKQLIFWGVLFVLSLYLIFTGLGPSNQNEIGELENLDKPTVNPEDPGSPWVVGFNWGMALAVLTAVASGGGFVATTFFALREDRRDAALHELQVETLKREITHKDLEIARLKREREKIDTFL